MPFAVVCPKCKAEYQVPDHLHGKPIGCRKCEFLFRAARSEPAVQPVQRSTAEDSVPATPASESAEPIVVLLDDSPASEEKPKRRRPVTWQDLEHRKRHGKSDDDESALPKSAQLPIPPWKMARWVGLGLVVGVVLVGLTFAIYYATLSKPEVPLKNSAEQTLRPPPTTDPHCLAALGEPFGIRPTPFEGDQSQVKFETPIESLCLGSGGRFIILKLQASTELLIFDVNQGKVTGSIPADAAARFAAGERKLVLSNPQLKTLERWDLFRQERDLEVFLPETEQVKELVMGSASDGPILQVFAPLNDNDATQNQVRFLDLETLAETPIQNFPGLPFMSQSLRASADGKVFTHWSHLDQAHDGGIITISGGEAQTRRSLPGPLFPTANGRMIYTPLGRLSTSTAKNVKTPDKNKSIIVPAVHGSFCVNIKMPPGSPEAPTGKVNPNPVYHCTVQTGANQTITKSIAIAPLFGETSSASRLEVDQRAILIPAAKVLVVIPAPSDRLVLYRCDLEALLAENDAEYLLVTSTAATEYQLGRVYIYPIEVLSKNGGVKFKLLRGPEGMSVSQNGVVSWSVPDDFERLAVAAEIEVKDAGGVQSRSIQLQLTRQDPLAPKNP